MRMPRFAHSTTAETGTRPSLSVWGEPTSAGVNAVAAFDDFDQIVDQIAATQGASASQRLDDAAAPLRRLRNIVFVAGLVIAALAALGYGQRLKEYR